MPLPQTNQVQPAGKAAAMTCSKWRVLLSLALIAAFPRGLKGACSMNPTCMPWTPTIFAMARVRRPVVWSVVLKTPIIKT